MASCGFFVRLLHCAEFPRTHAFSPVASVRPSALRLPEHHLHRDFLRLRGVRLPWHWQALSGTLRSSLITLVRRGGCQGVRHGFVCGCGHWPCANGIDAQRDVVNEYASGAVSVRAARRAPPHSYPSFLASSFRPFFLPSFLASISFLRSRMRSAPLTPPRRVPPPPAPPRQVPPPPRPVPPPQHFRRSASARRVHPGCHRRRRRTTRHRGAEAA